MVFNQKLKKSDKDNTSVIRKVLDPTVPFDLRIHIIIALSGTIGNLLGFTANFLIYGMNVPTAICATCALLLLLNTIFGLNSSKYRMFGWAMLLLLALFEFPFLVLTYGSVMYPYLMIGFLGLLMVSKKKVRIVCNSLLAVYYTALIVCSSLHPFIFGPQESTGLLGSAIATFLISLGALTGCVVSWQNVAVMETSDNDPVTGVLTWAGFQRSAKRFLLGEKSSQYAVLTFDVKNFRVVNSICGPDGGNRLLREVAEKIKHSELSPALICRIMADNFICIVEKEKLNFTYFNQLCEFQYQSNGKMIPLTMLCGIYFLDGSQDTVNSCCDKAELARRLIRAGQQEHYAVFNESTAETYRQETELLGELEEALHQKVFEPYYQPVVDSQTGKIVSAEALVRWNHPVKGILTPGAFIPILEKKELISDLDGIIVEKVSSLIEKQATAKEPIVPISVNLSRIDLYDDHLMKRLNVIIEEEADFDVKCRFELTESAYQALPQSTITMLSELREKGAKILLDDFGTGYSALSMITDYEFDYIKLDMSFTKKLETSEQVRGIVRSLIEIAHKLNSLVIMEGVENEAQLSFLKEAGCDQIQGFYFYKPMPEKEFIEVLKKQQ